MNTTSSSVVILGSGLAGLMTAYQLSQKNIPSLIFSKGPLIQTNTWKAQGGVAAAISKNDSIEKHIEDTLLAGAGLCVKEAVKKITTLGPELIQELINLGMLFDSEKNSSSVALAQEGGHQTRRILHVDDQTGRALHEFLLNKVSSDPLCELRPEKMIVHAENLNSEGFRLKYIQKDSPDITEIQCSHLVLATGGAGKAFLYTSNWKGATGDGLSIAHSLGAELCNLEFVQFHPTCLFHPQAKNFLISEALRGEGAKLINSQGVRFMQETHPKAELAPRDIVSKAIELEMKTSGSDCVFLDISHHKTEYLSQRFPHIFKKCFDLGIDISKAPIPVVPAAHYLCGGIKTENNLCSTSIHQLYAVGECGFTGLHGANRLASNSLLECLATAKLCAENLKGNIFSTEKLVEEKRQDLSAEEKILITNYWDEVRRLMWNSVGINRSDLRLSRALNRLNTISSEIHIKPWTCQYSHYLIELHNIVLFSTLCVQSALFRKESRGCNQNLNYPHTSEELYNTVVNSDAKLYKELL